MRTREVTVMWQGIRRAGAVVMAVASLVAGAAGPAFASDTWADSSCTGASICMGFTWTSGALAKIGQQSASLGVEPWNSAGTGVPPDPTTNERVAMTWTCSGAGGGYVTSAAAGDTHSWAYWDVTGYKPSFFMDCGGGGQLVFIRLLRKEWSNLFSDEPGSWTFTDLSVGIDVCPFTGGGVDLSSGGSQRTCVNTGNADIGGGVVTIKSSGTDDQGPYIDVLADVSNCINPGTSSTPLAYMAVDIPDPSSTDYGDHVAAGDQVFGPINALSGFQRFHVYTGLQNPHFAYLFCGTNTAGGVSGSGCGTPTMTGWHCWTLMSQDEYDPTGGGADYATGCNFDVHKPSTWVNGGICQTVLELQRANSQLASIQTDLANLHVTCLNCDGGTGGTGTVDTSGCTSGVLTSLVCLTKNIADAIGGLTQLFVTLFVPSSATFDAINSLSTNFTTHPPGSVLMGSINGITSVASGFNSSSCAELPAWNFGTTGPLAGVTAAWPSACGASAIHSAPYWGAMYALVQVCIYAACAFGIWRMVSSAFGGGKE